MRSGVGSRSCSGSWAAILVRLTPLSIPTSGATMPHMSLFELLFALLLVCVLAGIAAVAFLTWNLMRRADRQTRAVAELRQRLETGGPGQAARAPQPREQPGPAEAGVG